jgi:GNAT superfamily N-acetyltransferase
MNAPQKNLPLKMIRASLDGLPEFALPDGFPLRWYQPGDEAHWRRIHLAAERFIEITPELFGKQFGVGEERGLQPALAHEHSSGMNSALRDLRERQCYLLDPRGEVIGTGAAWFDDDFEGARWGRVHWMAILPEFQGRGLGKGLLTAICRRLQELGHQRAYLHTSAARIPAIKLYLRFGFEPVFRSAEEEAAWRNLFAVLHRAR